MRTLILGLTFAVAVFGNAPIQADEQPYDDQNFVSMAEESTNPPADSSLYQGGRYSRDMFLGDVMLGLHHSRSSVYTRSCSGYGGIRGRGVYAIRFQVLNAPATLDRIMIQYGNGQWDSINLGHRLFINGQSSQWFDLRGQGRCVHQIAVEGDTGNAFFYTRAVVRFWARM